MKLAAPTLEALLEQNVLEIKFTRRRQRLNLPPTRRMLCTNSQQLLLSQNGLKVLNYRPAGGTPVNKTLHNVVITWDLLKQDYRCVSADDCEMITQLPDGDEFWEYFNKTILPMTPAQKEAFMNS
jgi:hypothetical protein